MPRPWKQRKSAVPFSQEQRRFLCTKTSCLTLCTGTQCATTRTCQSGREFSFFCIRVPRSSRRCYRKLPCVLHLGTRRLGKRRSRGVEQIHDRAEKTRARDRCGGKTYLNFCMSTWTTVVCKQSNMTTQYMLTVIGTVLNILRVILLSSGYLFCERRASKIMMKRNRDCVRIRCCGLCTVQTYNWEPTGYFGELSRSRTGHGKMWSSAATVADDKTRKLLSAHKSKTSTTKKKDYA